jgi:nitroreductase
VKQRLIKIYKLVNRLRIRIFERGLPLYFYRSRILSSLYYFLFSPGFRREHQAVLAGKVKHLREAGELKANYYLLVRNTHRLEKGLLMKPRREIFAKEYLRETVDSYIGIMKKQAHENNVQLKWFTDVLDNYFEETGNDEVINAQRGRYFKFKESLNGTFSNLDGDSKSIPYYRNVEQFSKIPYEEFYKLNKQRRSVRWFIDKEVPRELIDKAILAAIQAPSACNRQPFEYRILDDPNLVEKAAIIPMGTAGYAHNLKVFVVVVGNLDAYFDERDRHLIYIDASLANMALMLALETLGLSSCPINWPDIEKKENQMAKLLKLKSYQRPVMCLGIGYADPAGMVAFSEKRELEQIRKYN